MEHAGQEVLLFYMVCDESGSMGPNGGIEEINRSLPELHATLASDPLVVDKSRLCIIAFSDNAEVILPLSKVTDIADMPGVHESGLTNYGAAIDLLTRTIEADVASMKSQGYKVYRPCVFFMSDGEPTDDWEGPYRTMLSHPFRPHILAFGVDGADPTVLGKIATLKAFVGVDRAKAGRALASVMGSIGKTIIASTSTAQGGIVNIDVPDDVDGMMSVPLVQLDEL
jgi:uncharacterized protein YegL